MLTLAAISTRDAGAAAGDFVSLTMPVRTESWVWDDSLHPIFRMNLPEGYLLHVLEEQFGPHIGASPMALLSVVGSNMLGRLHVAPPGSDLTEPISPLDVRDLLKGDNSVAAFSALVKKYATSGVFGVVPKFLAAGKPQRQARLRPGRMDAGRRVPGIFGPAPIEGPQANHRQELT